MKPNLDALYTARYALLTGLAVPKGPALDSILDVLRPHLGPEPEELYVPTSGAENDPDPVVGTTIFDDDLPPITDVSWLIGPGNRMPIVGRRFSPSEFARYLAGINEGAMTWDPKGVTIHHMAAPSLAQRPDGLTTQHMRNLRSWYLHLGWSRAPHLFVDDHGIWVFSPLTSRGVHARSFNGTHIGLEMLGNFDSEDPNRGRGKKVLNLSMTATALLCDWLGVKASAVNGHRDDPRTSKSCPGRK
ncbi:MAG: peptidoglycan recognition family protein, partial [Verrucomicrobiota bacterium]